MVYVYARAGANLFITARSEDRLQKVKGKPRCNYTISNTVRLHDIALHTLLLFYCDVAQENARCFTLNGEYLATQIRSMNRSMNNRFHSEAKLHVPSQVGRMTTL